MIEKADPFWIYQLLQIQLVAYSKTTQANIGGHLSAIPPPLSPHEREELNEPKWT